MNTLRMSVASDLSDTAVLEAIKMIKAEVSTRSKVGPGAVEFFEIWCAPHVGDWQAAREVGRSLLDAGVGVRVSLHWPFGGTRQWAVSNGELLVVNRGV